jgi:2-phospho-L-lactate guanylyltransferase
MRVLVVPVKSLERTKSRLAPVLSLSERAALTLAMVEDVLDACTGQDGWDVWVVSRDEAVLESAARRGARSVAEEGQSLNAAIRQVEGLLGKRSELAVVLGDLPLLSRNALATALEAKEAVVAAPARSDGGTNVLVRRPPSVIQPRFGRASFAKHRWAARRARVPFAEMNLPELGFDLDRPSDLHDVLGSTAAGRTRTICLEMRLPERLRLRIGEA